MKCLVVFLLLPLLHCVYSELLYNKSFPNDFKFGVASSSYQIEGAWNVNGKGENIWDRLTHSNPNHILDKRNGDIACDSYHKYKEDVQLVKALGVDFYRFSISWARILPTGYLNHINPDGIRYYNALIDELISNGIEPVITIFHWDLPQTLQEVGGWTSPALVEHFVNYADLLYKTFGDRVKKWITINEPLQICKFGYGDGILAPAYNSSGTADYLCSYIVLKAHAKAYRLYDTKYRASQKGICGITVSCTHIAPLTDSAEDLVAAQRMFDFDTGIYTNPVFGTNGDWPEGLKKIIAENSAVQGFASSRLPSFTAEEIAEIKGSSDFFGLNLYTARYVTDMANYDPSIVSWANDARVEESIDENWISGASPWFYAVPWGMRKTLKQIKDAYGDIPIYITENGFSDYGELDDYQRVNYYLTYLSACLEAIYEDNVNLVAYTAWSLLDVFEWMDGYTHKFGIYHVDFEDPNRPRTPKMSAKVYQQIVADRKLPASTVDVPKTTEKPTENPDGDSANGLLPITHILILSVITLIII